MGAEWVRVEKNKVGAVFLHAVHRLDRAVSGVVLFARTSKALSRLNQAMREGRSAKIYHAWVEGYQCKKGTCINYILHSDYRAALATDKDPDAKKAILHYTVLSSKPIRHYSKSNSLPDVIIKFGFSYALGCPLKEIQSMGLSKAPLR